MKNVIGLVFVLAIVSDAVAGEPTVREHKKGVPSGTSCRDDKECDLGMICYPSRQCKTGCRASADCPGKQVCAPVRYCEGERDCRKQCHEPKWLDGR